MAGWSQMLGGCLAGGAAWGTEAGAGLEDGQRAGAPIARRTERLPEVRLCWPRVPSQRESRRAVFPLSSDRRAERERRNPKTNPAGAAAGAALAPGSWNYTTQTALKTSLIIWRRTIQQAQCVAMEETYFPHIALYLGRRKQGTRRSGLLGSSMLCQQRHLCSRASHLTPPWGQWADPALRALDEGCQSYQGRPKLLLRPTWKLQPQPPAVWGSQAISGVMGQPATQSSTEPLARDPGRPALPQ